MITRGRNIREVLHFLLTVFLALAVTILATSVAMAYPSGWTSDNTVATGAFQVDIISRGSNVYLVYTSSAGIYYRQSADKGVTWSTATLISSETNAQYPQVTVKSDGTVYVAYASDSGLRVKSYNGTWTTVGSNASAVSYVSMTHYGDSPAVAWQMNNPGSGRQDVYYGVVGGSMAGIELTDDPAGSGDEFVKPRIASNGTEYMVVYDCNDFIVDEPTNPDDDGLWYTRFSPAKTYAKLVADSTGHIYQDADIAYRGSNQYNVVFTDNRSASDNRVYSKSWDGASWGAHGQVLSTASTNPYAKSVPMDDHGAVCRANNNADVQWVRSDVENDSIMTGVSPSNSPRALATASDGDASYIYVAVINGSNNLLVKRQDTQSPTASGITVTGAKAFTEGAETVYYAKANFNISFQNVVDEWNLTGVEPGSETGYTGGVTKVHVRSGIPGSFTFTVPLVGGNPIQNAPWDATVDVSSIEGDGDAYIKGIPCDTALNQGDSPIVHTVIDRTPPTVAITDDYTPVNDWSPTNVHATLTADDPYGLDKIQYKKAKEGQTAEWQTYTSPITLADGRWTLTARAVDRAGNYSETISEYYNVDTVGPSIQVTRPEGDTAVTYNYNEKEYYRFAANVTDTGEVAWAGFYIDNATQPYYATDSSFNMTCAYDFTNTPEGNHVFKVRAQDKAGHWTTKTKNFVLVKSATIMGDWYFAEGTTQSGFTEFLSVYNTSKSKTANVTFDFCLTNGQVISKNATVTANARSTFNVADMIGNGKDVATHVKVTGAPVIVERPMYFNYRGITGGTNSLGVNILQKSWHFAEGTTRDSGHGGPFDTYLCLANFSGTDAQTTVTYMLETGENINKTYAVPANSRKTITVNNEVGANHDVSMSVSSNVNIMAERAMYFNHGGMADGSIVVGTTSTSKEMYFAEGNTQPGFEEYITIQNPNANPADVTLSFVVGNLDTVHNEKDPAPKTVRVPATTRATYRLLDMVPAGRDIAVKLTSDLPVVAERPIYFGNYKGWNGGDVAMGCKALYEEAYLAEGTTRNGFDEWVTIFSPTSGNAVRIYYNFPDGVQESDWYPLSTSRRLTVNVNEELKKWNRSGQDVSIQVIGDNPFCVERPMYFNYQGNNGGHIGAGYVVPGN